MGIEVLDLPDETVSVDFSKIKDAVEGLSREILTIQAICDEQATTLLLHKYSVITESQGNKKKKKQKAQNKQKKKKKKKELWGTL
ncbi:hypothetical protein Ahy_B01g053814 isoform A [Arachis hypogaea]|uniref:Uncharacterized protein n=1 Tax=Arachis hypogaea TaxID=3818 RepID=A0A445ASN0_ARAHY|nr:hypothetical protein Ahy_B01g053814 isoform A [Arachis hypogaea]